MKATELMVYVGFACDDSRRERVESLQCSTEVAVMAGERDCESAILDVHWRPRTIGFEPVPVTKAAGDGRHPARATVPPRPLVPLRSGA